MSKSEVQELTCPYCAKPFWYSNRTDLSGLFVVKPKEPVPPSYKEMQKENEELKDRLNKMKTALRKCLDYKTAIEALKEEINRSDYAESNESWIERK